MPGKISLRNRSVVLRQRSKRKRKGSIFSNPDLIEAVKLYTRRFYRNEDFYVKDSRNFFDKIAPWLMPPFLNKWESLLSTNAKTCLIESAIKLKFESRLRLGFDVVFAEQRYYSNKTENFDVFDFACNALTVYCSDGRRTGLQLRSENYQYSPRLMSQCNLMKQASTCAHWQKEAFRRISRSKSVSMHAFLSCELMDFANRSLGIRP